jgi:hypothetical protein
MRGMMTLFALRPSARATHAVEHQGAAAMSEVRTDEPRLSDLRWVYNQKL